MKNYSPIDAPIGGEIRKKSGFLFLPKKINNEIKWLECAKWVEELTIEDGLLSFKRCWKPIKWE